MKKETLPGDNYATLDGEKHEERDFARGKLCDIGLGKT